MILILTNKACTTTNYVIDWLIAKNAQFLRINSEDKVNLVKLSLVEVEFEINEKRYTDLKVNFWHLEHFVNLAA